MLNIRNTPPKTKGSEGSNENGREGGDDSLVNSLPTDSRSDEKVVVNQHGSDKIVNGPSQTSAYTNERSSSDEEILD